MYLHNQELTVCVDYAPLPVAIATATPPYDTPTQLSSIRQYPYNQCRRSDKILYT